MIATIFKREDIGARPGQIGQVLGVVELGLPATLGDVAFAAGGLGVTPDLVGVGRTGRPPWCG